MGRKHALVLSLAVAACVVTGASAALKTVHLGATAATPPHVADSVIAARSAKLDRFAASLAHARRSRPPALPQVPHFAPVAMPTPPAPAPAASTPAPAAVSDPSTTVAPAKRHPKVVYVRPAPVVTTVQATTTATPATGDDEDDDSGESDGHDDGGAGGGFGGDDGGDG